MQKCNCDPLYGDEGWNCRRKSFLRTLAHIHIHTDTFSLFFFLEMYTNIYINTQWNQKKAYEWKERHRERVKKKPSHKSKIAYFIINDRIRVLCKRLGFWFPSEIVKVHVAHALSTNSLYFISEIMQWISAPVHQIYVGECAIAWTQYENDTHRERGYEEEKLKERNIAYHIACICILELVKVSLLFHFGFHSRWDFHYIHQLRYLIIFSLFFF